MRTRPAALLTILLLTACQLVNPTPTAPPGLDAAGLTRVAEAVNATGTAQAEVVEAQPTLTPTPDRLPLDQSLLSGGQMNVLLGIWPMTPQEAGIPSASPLCIRSCVETLWISLDGQSTLRISLFEFPNRDQVVERLREIQAAQAVLDVRALAPPEDMPLPDGSWIQDNGGTGSRYTLHTWQGRVLVILTLYLPEYSETENISFLAQYALEQVHALAAAGW